jgi:oligoribonuclease NrnB/cAMP/cGMP phosphodiesterase (DHH superfamily)
MNINLVTREKVGVIYHKNCNDGTTAAAILLTKFPNSRFFALDYNYKKKEFENILHKVDGKTSIYIVDFSLKPEDAKGLARKARKVLLLDHHISEKDKNLKINKEVKNFEFVFDNNKSGSSLTWAYFYPDSEIPEIVKLVEDGDLCRNRFGKRTKHVNNYLSMFLDYPKKVSELLFADIEDIIEKGRIISEYLDSKKEKFLKEAKEIKLKIGEHVVKAYNTDQKQEVGIYLARKHNEPVAFFEINGYEVKISFRSCDNQKHTALEMAKALNGGGHKNAAAAIISLKQFLEMIIFE